MKSNQFKETVIQEIRAMMILALYLVLFLNSLTIFHSIILRENIFTWWHFGYNLIEGLLLAKIISLGRMLKLGDVYGEKSLALPVLYKAIVFSLFVVAFSFLEHFVIGSIRGKSLPVLWQELSSQGINVIAGKSLIMFLIFIPLFSFLEIGRVFGERKIYNLFFRRNKADLES